MSLPLTRWCGRCASPVTAVGHHTASGDFDPYSVPVSDEEIDAALMANHASYGRHSRAQTRWCIAFGKHIGTYEQPEIIAAKERRRRVALEALSARFPREKMDKIA